MKYKFLDWEIEQGLATVWLNRPPANELNIEFMDELIAAHSVLAADDRARAVLIASRFEKYFCNGLEAAWMLGLDFEGRRAVFFKVIEMIRELYAFPKPVGAVIGGHAMAGGAVLGILADHRFMAAGKGRYCFSEVRVGLTVPPLLLEVIAGVTGPRHLVRVAQIADAFLPEEALAIGLVDAVWAAEKLMDESRKFMRRVMELPLASVVSVKRAIRARVLASANAHSDIASMQEFLGANFEEGLRAVVEKRRPRFA